MVLYNLTNFSNYNSTVGQLQFVNDNLTGGWFGILIVIALFVIILTRLMYYNPAAAFLTAGFMTSTLTLFLWMLELVPMVVLVITLILPMIGILLVLIYGAK